MSVRLTRGQTISGVNYPAGVAIVGLDKQVEDVAMQGGGASNVNLAVVPMTDAQASVLPALASGAGRRRHGMWAAWTLLQWQAALPVQTWRFGMELPAGANPVMARVAFTMNTAGSYGIDGVAAASTGAALDKNPTNGGAWTTGTFGGGMTAGATIPQGIEPLTRVAGNVFDKYWSDYIRLTPVARTDGGAGASVLFSATSAAGGVGTTNNTGGIALWNTESLKLWDAWQAASLLTGAVTGASIGSSPIAAVEFVMDGAALCIGMFGDSISLGYKTGLPGRSWVSKAAALLSSRTGCPVTSMLCSTQGDQTEASYNRFLAACRAGTLPDVVIFCPYTRNQVLTPQQSLGYAAAFVRKCWDMRVQPVLALGIYEGATPANNTRKDATNALVKTFAAAVNVPVLNLDIFTDATYLDADQIHPANLGDTMMSVAAANDLESTVRVLLA